MSEFDAAVESIIRLIETAPFENRVAVADWIGRSIANNALLGADGGALENILEALCRDSEPGVRQVVSRHVRHSPHLPPAVVQALVDDVDSISIPFIRFSESLTDTDLLRLVKENNTLRQISVARRSRVSHEISHALVESRKFVVVKTVVANAGADIHELDFVQVLDLFGTADSVMTLLARRTDLPADISRRLAVSRREREDGHGSGDAEPGSRLEFSTPRWLIKS